MTHGRAFVDHLDAMLFEMVDMFLRLVARCLDDLDPSLDDRLPVFGIGGWLDCGQDGEVHTERLVRHLLRARDLFGKVFRGGLGQRRQEPKSSSICYGCHHFCVSDPLHATLDDRVLDAEFFRKAGLNGHGFLPKCF